MYEERYAGFCKLEDLFFDEESSPWPFQPNPHPHHTLVEMAHMSSSSMTTNLYHIEKWALPIFSDNVHSMNVFQVQRKFPEL